MVFCRRLVGAALVMGLHLGWAQELNADDADDAAKAVNDTQACLAADADSRLLHVPSPDWRDQMVYMIMVDRFNDGDPTNNDLGFGEYDPTNPNRFHGGDLRGIEAKLDYLQALGVTAIWITPPVANQTMSSVYDMAGWHGYWAVDFKTVDPHLGTLDDYRALSHALHCRGMYLLQDIVTNHLGIFFGYEGEYDPEDTAKNFVLFEDPDGLPPAPTMAPFHMIDRRNPEHAAADIYHWTPAIEDYRDAHQENFYQLGDLADINTENEQVIDVLKSAYRYWMREVGVDGFRVDTAKYVSLDFWTRFFHDADGIYPYARALGKDRFLTFGETFEGSEPFEVTAEKRMLHLMTDAEKPGFNSMLGFPVYFEIDRVVSAGQATAQLGARINALMELFPNPHVIPTFIDNHDTKRFLSSNTEAAFRQALALIYTIPGIPIIYQGTEQGLVKSRPSLFSKLWDGGDAFSRGSPHFDYVRSLTTLRKNHPSLRRGGFELLDATSAGPGVFSFAREYENERLAVVMNTANHPVLASNLNAGFAANAEVRSLFPKEVSDFAVTDAKGRVTLELPARAVLVLSEGAVLDDAKGTPPPEFTITIDQVSGGVHSADFTLTGRVSEPFHALQVIRSGSLENAEVLLADAEGRWRLEVPVRDLGERNQELRFYSPSRQVASDAFSYLARVESPEIELDFEDELNDDHGPSGRYFGPTWNPDQRTRDIEGARVRAAGANLELTLTMGEISQVWMPTNGFDNVMITTFVDVPTRQGIAALPEVYGKMPQGGDWDIAHVGYGWGSYFYSAEGASAERRGEALGATPHMHVDAELKQVTMVFEGALMGVEDWRGSRMYVTTWDVSQEGDYLPMQPDGSKWGFGGAEPNASKIMDDIYLVIPDGAH